MDDRLFNRASSHQQSYSWISHTNWQSGHSPIGLLVDVSAHEANAKSTSLSRFSLIRAEPVGEVFAHPNKIPDKASEIHIPVVPLFALVAGDGMVLIETRCKRS